MKKKILAMPIDLTDPVDIAIMVDPKTRDMLDAIEDHDTDYQTLFDGVKIESSYDDDDEDEDDEDYEDEEGYNTFDAIMDNSTDFLDMEADDLIDAMEDDDSDGELIDMVVSGYNHEDE